MNLADRDKEIIKAHLDRGEPLPARYKLALFEDAPEVELVWQGKTSEVTNVVLPFQSIEQIDEPRAEGKEQLGLFSVGAGGRQARGWANKLIWGDNKLVLSSLKNGPLRREIEAAGGLKLIYIDPPFDVGGGLLGGHRGRRPHVHRGTDRRRRDGWSTRLLKRAAVARLLAPKSSGGTVRRGFLGFPGFGNSSVRG